MLEGGGFGIMRLVDSTEASWKSFAGLVATALSERAGVAVLAGHQSKCSKCLDTYVAFPQFNRLSIEQVESCRNVFAKRFRKWGSSCAKQGQHSLLPNPAMPKTLGPLSP